MIETTNQVSATSNTGGAVAAGVIVTLLVIGGATAAVIVVVVILFKRRKQKSGNIQGESPYHLDAFENQLYETDVNTINGTPLSSDNGIHNYSLPFSNRTDEVYEDMDVSHDDFITLISACLQ